MKVRASSLFFALIISLLIALVSSGFILATSWHWTSIDGYLEDHKLINNCKSGMSILLASSACIGANEESILDLYNTGEDSVLLSRKDWGIYEIVRSRAFNQGNEVSETALIGRVISKKDRFAMYLTDRNSPLSLCGRTVIKGKAYLPEAGVKRAYIEGQNFVGTQMINGQIVRSNNRVPKLQQEVIDALSVPPMTNELTYEVVNFLEIEVDSVGRSFFEKTLVVNFSDSVSLSRIQFEGNVILKSNKSIFIRNSCLLNKVLVFAPNIYVEYGASISCQLFATERIVVDDNCNLNFPSVLSVSGGNSNSSSSLVIGENSSVTGAVIMNGNSNGQAQGIKIGENSLVVGQVYSSNTVDLKGDIHGSLVCEKLKLKTPSSVYENHLLNVEINESKLPVDFPGVACFENNHLEKRVISYPQ